MNSIARVLIALIALFLTLVPAGVRAQSCTPPAADPEIVALARALKYDPSLIYEYIYFNIEYSPTFGSKKGALGTYLDGRGTQVDQNVLFVTLLQQSCVLDDGAAIDNAMAIHDSAVLIHAGIAQALSKVLWRSLVRSVLKAT